MAKVGIRELRQNASAVVAQVAAGESITITDRKRPVAQITPLPTSRLESIVGQGKARPAKTDIANLPPQTAGPEISAELAAMRDDERF